VSFVTLRTWNKSIKQHQMSALKIVKSDPDPLFVDAVAGEMAEHVRRLFGVPRVGCVVPVPGGHSKGEECLSVQLARALALKLKVPFVDALSQPPRKGRSHPRKNAELKAPKLVTDQAHESVLLIDDVATSGRHIELAVQSLRTMAQHVTAIAWIGAA
jgi:predicted amidophosphoribosyltransferase